jgi:hypothetical protein
MDYLSPSEYGAFGLESTTPAAWVTAASAVIESYCRRPTLGVTQYQERVRVAWGRNTLRLTYLPLAAIDGAASALVQVRGRYAEPRHYEGVASEIAMEAAVVFALPGTWVDLDAKGIDLCAESGELTLPMNVLGLSFEELEITYTAGLAVIPNAVKVACAQVVRNAQATPALNVRRERLDRMYLDYFSDSLVDQTVKSLLAPYVAQKVG